MPDDDAILPDDPDFETIEAAVRETARGRWFLAEFAARIRRAETDKVLAAIARLGVTLSLGQVSAHSPARVELSELARIIARTKAEIAGSLPPEDAAGPVDALAEVMSSLDGASESIRDLAGGIHEVAWRLREEDANPSACTVLERHAIAIYTACGTQDLSLSRLAKAADLLLLLERRIGDMIARPQPAAEAPSAPRDASRAYSAAPDPTPYDVALPRRPREEADAAFSPPDTTTAAPARRSVGDRMAALTLIDALGTREKLQRFT